MKKNGSIDIGSVRARFRAVRDGLNAAFREREDAIECIILAALSQSHALLVGPPGTAKSALFFGFLASFPDARKFQTLVTKFGTEDEYFGPVKLSALKNDLWERNLDGRLAAVECAFLDEVFKGSDSVLNAFLSAMNERLYKGQPIPLRLLVGASNELPEEEILAAIYDRFLLRDVVEYVQADATWMQLVAAPPEYKPAAQIALAEWDAACKDVQRLEVPQRVVEELLRLRTALKADGLVLSDRRWIALTRVLKAAAWLDDAPTVELDHLSVLKYGLWNKPEDRARVVAVLQTVDRSVVAQAIDIVDEALRGYANRPTEPASYQSALPQLADKVTEAGKRVQDMLKNGVSRRAHARIQPKLDELKKAHDALTADLSKRYALP
ncbi:AAA family ATPase [Polyangium mundeleinium]|uniref:AAA family ATPase n=1 Tax=Polyangium mundeleinium TaxID=2995306 RepID=A0ABT5EMZ5_9BACT|nr:AAA family ATPase [Polyangium mundeleinium]MDC0743203.1 AAA family ATPase [Polyangium mundeleinium]